MGRLALPIHFPIAFLMLFQLNIIFPERKKKHELFGMVILVLSAKVLSPALGTLAEGVIIP